MTLSGRLSGPWLQNPATQTVLTLLEAAGHRAYVVGGAVRNALMGEPVGDVDLTTNAHPETVIQLARGQGHRVIPTGLAHGTVTVLIGDAAFEITTFRTDVTTNGRHAEVAFSNDIAADATRRDFTMNALYCDARGAVFDPLGTGIADARARRIRFVGEPQARIREDYLRILRYFRFLACYGAPEHGLEPEALAACAAEAQGIETLSRERIGAEMRKLLAAPNPAPALNSMAHSGVLPHVLPEARTDEIALLIHMEEELGVSAQWLTRLAALGGVAPAKALRLSNAEEKQRAALRAGAIDGLSLAALGHELGTDSALQAYALRAALIQSPIFDARLAQAEAARGAQTPFPIKAADLAHSSQGPALGARLRALKAHWLSEDLRPSKSDLLAQEI